ncbi:hypothetical protein C8R45DRAFT_1078917 [Mycena sanguinolenta]|nr:hypothetical protein C8R45DRAFT_1078917 [Mycena sanguinolenta]
MLPSPLLFLGLIPVPVLGLALALKRPAPTLALHCITPSLYSYCSSGQDRERGKETYFLKMDRQIDKQEFATHRVLGVPSALRSVKNLGHMDRYPPAHRSRYTASAARHVPALFEFQPPKARKDWSSQSSSARHCSAKQHVCKSHRVRIQALSQPNVFSKLSVVVASVLITLAAVTPPTSNQCCASVVHASSSATSLVAAVLGLDLSGILVDVGLSCSPITVLGNNCGGTTVTCDAPEDEWGGLIAINCIPIML